jgi:inosose dehydratase
MNPLRIGCQTFTWEMLGDAWNGGPDDLLAAIAAGGYAGVEITDRMIGGYAGRPEAFGRALSAHGLSLVAYAFGSASGFTEPSAFDADLALVERALDFAAHFPGAAVSLGSATIMSDGPLESKFAAAAKLYNAAGALGAKAHVPLAVHPSSHHNTLLFTRADYDRLMAMLDPGVGWVPDSGHILRGGQDLLDTLSAHAARIRYVHLKDVDASGQWRMLGEGVCPTLQVVEALRAAPAFNGWLVVEEESDVARTDPAAAVRRNYETLATLLGGASGTRLDRRNEKR